MASHHYGRDHPADAPAVPGPRCGSCEADNAADTLAALRLTADGSAAVNGFAAGWSAGWESGPAVTAEQIAADQVRIGDALVLDGQDIARVTDVRRGDFWLTTGLHAPGIAIGWRSLTGTASGMLFRGPADMLNRLISAPNVGEV